MHGFSTVDGFMEVNDSVAEMIERVANEPSVGLFYVQQHTQNAVPNLIHTMNRVVEKSNEVALHTADLEDSISMVRSMKEFGVPIADQMAKDIQKSLIIMSSMRLQKRLFRPSIASGGEGCSSWGGLRMARSGSWGGSMFGSSSVSTQVKGSRHWDYQYDPSTSQPPQMGEGKATSNYLSTMLSSAKKKAAVLRWPQRDASGAGSLKGNKFSASTGESLGGIEVGMDELPVSGQTSHQSEAVEDHEEPSTIDDRSMESCINDPSDVMETYEKFKSDHEAKLEEWLKESDNGRLQIHADENSASAD